MAEPNDWRLMGQERFLTGAVLRWSDWRPVRPGWDHDHCEFCFAMFAEESIPEALRSGYTTMDGYRWVCPTCFADFREQFGWQLADERGRA